MGRQGDKVITAERVMEITASSATEISTITSVKAISLE
jgi:hypothetical protein